MTSAANLVFSGKNATHFVHRSTTVRTYLKPSDVTEPGLYRSIAIARNGVADNIGTKGVLNRIFWDLALLHLMHWAIYLETRVRMPLKW